MSNVPSSRVRSFFLPSSLRSSTRIVLCAAMLSIATTAGSAELAAPATAAGAVQPVVVRAVTRFDFDGTALGDQDRARILADVGKMKDVSWQSVTATGHTDSVGPAGYNERLSARRADAVKAYLVGKGLEASMIDTAAKAATVPIADNSTATGRARNRRTEIEFRGVRAVSP